MPKSATSRCSTAACRRRSRPNCASCCSRVTTAARFTSCIRAPRSNQLVSPSLRWKAPSVGAFRFLGTRLLKLDTPDRPSYTTFQFAFAPRMHSNDYLFPARQSRREFLASASATSLTLAAGAGLVGCASRPPATPPVRLGAGVHTYEAVAGWGQLPPGLSYGFGCAIVVDGQDRIYITSRSTNPCVAIFDRHGQLLETWSNDFGDRIGLSTARVKDTAHCLYWSR